MREEPVGNESHEVHGVGSQERSGHMNGHKNDSPDVNVKDKIVLAQFHPRIVNPRIFKPRMFNPRI